METNKNNELKNQWWYKSTIKSLHDNIAEIAVSIVSLQDIKQTDMPTPIIDFFYCLLVTKIVDKEDLNQILDKINKKILDSEEIIDNIRKEMNI